MYLNRQLLVLCCTEAQRWRETETAAYCLKNPRPPPLQSGSCPHESWKMRGAEREEKRITSINGCQAGVEVARAMPGQQQVVDVNGWSAHKRSPLHRPVPVDRRPAVTVIWHTWTVLFQTAAKSNVSSYNNKINGYKRGTILGKRSQGVSQFPIFHTKRDC